MSVICIYTYIYIYSKVVLYRWFAIVLKILQFDHFGIRHAQRPAKALQFGFERLDGLVFLFFLHGRSTNHQEKMTILDN